MERDPEVASDLFLSVLATEIPAEMYVLGTKFEIAGSAVEAKEQGEAGKQALDSVKRLIRWALLRLPWMPGVPLRGGKREERADEMLHTLNEVLGIKFRVSA